MWLLVMFSGDVYTTPLFSEQNGLDQRTSMIRTAIAADDKEVLVILRRMKSAISHFVGHKKIYECTRVETRCLRQKKNDIPIIRIFH